MWFQRYTQSKFATVMYIKRKIDFRLLDLVLFSAGSPFSPPSCHTKKNISSMSKQREKEHATPYFDSYPEGRIVQHFKLFSTYWFEFWSFKLYSVAVIKANLSALTVFMYCTHRHLHIEDKELHKCVHLFHATILAVVWQQQNAKWDIQWKRKNI